MRVRTAQLPHPPDGADRIIVTPGAVIVLDGASAFGPPAVSPAAYADRLGTELASAIASTAAPLPQILATAIGVTASALDLRDDHGPSSTVAIARLSGGNADLLILGDSSIAYRSAGTTAVLTDSRLDRLGLPQARRYRDRLATGSGYDTTHAATLRDLQAGQRVRRNAPGGYWIASANPEAAAHAVTVTVPQPPLEWIVLATDGAIGIARYLGLDDWEAIIRSDQGGLSALLQRCHEWEENADPGGRQLPRAKRHDDKAIATIRRPDWLRERGCSDVQSRRAERHLRHLGRGPAVQGARVAPKVLQ